MGIYQLKKAIETLHGAIIDPGFLIRYWKQYPTPENVPKIEKDIDWEKSLQKYLDK